MGIGAAVIGFFKALPKLLDLAEAIGKKIEERRLVQKLERLNNDLEKLDDCILKATEAKTLSERVSAAKELSNLVASWRD